MTEKYFFIHCLKAAGTSLFFQLRQQVFDEESVYPTVSDMNHPWSSFDTNYLIKRSNDPDSNYQVFTGHFPFCTMEILGGDFKSFTVLREPVDRIISFLRHHKKLTPEDRDKSLEELYDDPFIFQSKIQNHMVKMFSLTPETGKDGMLGKVDFDESHFEKAKRNLKHVDVIGLQEDYLGFCKNLERKFGWEFKHIIHGNKTNDTEAVSENFKDRIGRDNELDVRFYKFAKFLVARRQNNISTDPEK